MERLKNLNRYQKTILILLCTMVVVFAAVYAVVSSRVGFEYRDTILLPHTEGTDTVYTGVIAAEQITITVTDDKEVTFNCGEKMYGPYTVIEDPTAIPEGEDWETYTAGVEVREGSGICFRGGIISLGEGNYLLYNEDGSNSNIGIYYTDSNGIKIDMEGNVVDFMKPSVSEILELVDGPVLKNKGVWSVWLLGLLFAVVGWVSVLFADELFMLSLSFRVRDPEYAEPSDWELIGRYIGWTVITIGTLAVFIIGLR